MSQCHVNYIICVLLSLITLHIGSCRDISSLFKDSLVSAINIVGVSWSHHFTHTDLSKPTERNLMNSVACRIPAKWREVGRELGLSGEELDTIKKKSGDWRHCFWREVGRELGLSGEELDTIKKKSGDWRHCFWREVGRELGLSGEELDTIKKKSGDWRHCFSDVFQSWRKQGSPPYTWASIIRALRAPEVWEIGLSMEVEEQFSGIQWCCCILTLKI